MGRSDGTRRDRGPNRIPLRVGPPVLLAAVPAAAAPRGLAPPSLPIAAAAVLLLAVVVLAALVWLQAVRRRRIETLADSLFRLAPDAVLLVGPDGRIRRLNEEAEALLGWAPEELVGEPVETLVPPELRDAHVGHREVFERQPSRRRMGKGRELAVLRRDGSRLTAEISLGPVPGAVGSSTLVAIRDVSEQRLARRELQRRLREVEDLNRELEAFSYSVSHDLRAPMRAVDGFARMLAEEHAGKLGEEPQRLLGVIRQQAAFMRRLTEDLLRLSRFSRQPLCVESIDMASLVRQVVEARPGDGAAIECGPLPAGRGDPRLLQQVWANYLDNALKFSAGRTAPRVWVEGGEGGGEVVYAVRDNGVGFDPAASDRLFTVFQRLHSDREFEGSGVGLALVQRIVHRHGGRVWAEGRPGEGATFYFSLPAGAGAVQPAPPAEAAP
jgi:PAS domain S-box-containing protein